MIKGLSRRAILLLGAGGVMAGVASVFVQPASAAPGAETDTALGAYRLGSGDKLRVTVFGHEDLSGEFDVDGSGIVSLPLIRNIKAEGLTVRELEQQITERLSPEYLKNPSVNVEVLNYRPFYIYGEVTKPGSYPFVSGMKVVNAVAMAGGFTYRARTGHVRIIRASDASRTPQDADRDTPVMPGDVIEVPERYF